MARVNIILILTWSILLIGATAASAQRPSYKESLLSSLTVSSYTKKQIDTIPDTVNRTWIVSYDGQKGFPLISNSQKHLTKILAIVFNGSIESISPLLHDPRIVSIELDQQIHLSDDTVYENINMTRAPEAWNTTNGTGISIAIIDSGIAPHQDLAIAGGMSAISNNYTDIYGHGTSIAGVAAGLMNGIGLIGVAPEVDLYAVKVGDSSPFWLSDVLAGLDWAINNNMSIISMSFGSTEYSSAFDSAISDAWANGAILVASAGNSNSEVEYPARYNHVIAVGSVSSNKNRSGFSNKGPWLDVMARGTQIYTTSLNGNYTTSSGTSFSTPHVSGLAALFRAKNASYTNAQIQAIIENTAEDLGDAGKDDLFGIGLAVYTDYPNPEFARVNLTDNFTIDASTEDDGITFLNDPNLSVKLIPPRVEGDAYCIDYGSDGNYDLCRYNDTDDFTNCSNYSVTLSGIGLAFHNVCGNGLDCIQDVNFTQTHHGITTSNIRANKTNVILYRDCDDSAAQKGTYNYTNTYNIIDQRRAVCVNDTHYHMEGRYSTGGAYVAYGGMIGCNVTQRCDYVRDDEQPTTNRTIKRDPCRFDADAACTATEQCLNGLNCTDNICINRSISLSLNVINLSSLFSDAKNAVYESILKNTGSATLSELGWRLDAGDGTVITSIENTSLSTGKSMVIFIDHNYSHQGLYKIIMTGASEDLNHTLSINQMIGDDIRIVNYSILSSQGASKTFATILLNNGSERVSKINWTFLTGDTGGAYSFSSSSNIDMPANSIVKLFIEYSYANTSGEHNATINVSSNRSSAQESVSVSFGAGIELLNYSTIGISLFEAAFELIARNNEDEPTTSNAWQIDTKEGIINSSIDFNLSANETIMIFVGKNYASFGEFNTSATINSSQHERFAIARVSETLITNLSSLEYSGLNRTFEMIVQNAWNQTKTYQWSLDSGIENITSMQGSDIVPGYNLIVFVRNEYPSLQNWSITATAWTNQSNDTTTITI